MIDPLMNQLRSCMSRLRGRLGRPRLARTLLVGLLTATALSPMACKEEPPPPPPRRPPPPPPPPPDPMEGIELEPIVVFPEDQLPPTPASAGVMADLANALARGDAEALAALLAPEDALLLDQLLAHGEWEEAVSGIQAVRLTSVQDLGNIIIFGLGLQDEQGAYLTGWQIVVDEGHQLRGFDVAPVTAERLMTLDDAPLTPQGISSLPPPPAEEEEPEE